MASITVVVPRLREEGIIASKVEDVRANGYEGQLSVLVVADGDPGTAKVAESCGARVLSAPDRLGRVRSSRPRFCRVRYSDRR